MTLSSNCCHRKMIQDMSGNNENLLPVLYNTSVFEEWLSEINFRNLIQLGCITIGGHGDYTDEDELSELPLPKGGGFLLQY